MTVSLLMGVTVIGPAEVMLPPSTVKEPHCSTNVPASATEALLAEDMVMSSPVEGNSRARPRISWLGMVLKVPELVMMPAVLALS